jgi:hypothetical protein
MGKSLVADLGARYVRDFFNHAMFDCGDGKIHRLRAVDDNHLTVDSITLSDKTPKWERGYVKSSVLEDFASFKYPKLGYRQFQQGRLGNIVVMVGTVRSTQRGLKEDHLRYEQLPVYAAVDFGYFDGYNKVNDARRAKELFRPTFTPFSQGIKHLLDGDWIGFAVSEDLAVALSISQSHDRFADVFYRGRIVGNVDANGQVNLVNKVLQRASVKKKLFQ